MQTTPVGVAALAKHGQEWADRQILWFRDNTTSLYGYVRGACFDGMGWHYFKDLLAPNGTISWQASNLMPVVPMYDPIHGKFHAIFFASAVVQQVSTLT